MVNSVTDIRLNAIKHIRSFEYRSLTTIATRNEMPKTITVCLDNDGVTCTDHLYLNEKTGTAIFKLNDWEEKTLKAELQRADFVCWYRNPTKGSGAILVPYMMNKKPKPMYPDLLIVRKHPELGFVYDILEPHGAQYVDGMAKAKGLAKYAEECPMVERIQMIRVIDNKLIRLSMTNPLVRDALYNAPEDNDDQLSVIFQNYGFEE